jgi:ABC-type polysaccharide/polyol phosphate transport system ATPase subunit
LTAIKADLSSPKDRSPAASDLAVTARGVGKRFDIYRSDRGRILEFFGNRSHHVEFWALRNIDFDIRRGSAFGVIGANGAGKSTLLRLLSGVSQPTEGTIEVRSRMAGLLDLGLGFHPEFTGRENVLLSCTMLGMPESLVEELIPKVVEFAELEGFIDHPVRTYSAGMQLRLGFAITAHMDYEIFFIDEVLAVGDQYFQRKCVAKIEEFLEQNKTLVLVSHDLHAIRNLCSEVIWLHAGRIVARGPTAEVVDAYVDVARDRRGRIKARLFGGAESAHSRAMERRVAAETATTLEPANIEPIDDPDEPFEYWCSDPDEGLRATLREALSLPADEVAEEWARKDEVANYEATHGERPIITGTGEARILSVSTLDAAGREADHFETGQPLVVSTTFKTLTPIENPILGVALFRNDEVYVFGPNTRFDKVKQMEGTYDGVYTFFIRYPRLRPLRGTYRISVAIFDKHHLKPHVWHNQLYEITVGSPTENHGIVDMDRDWGLIRHLSGDAETLP